MSTNPFVGTWRLISVEAKTAGGEMTHLYGKGASGYLIYSPDGYMSVVITQPDRANFASADFRAGGLEEKLGAFDTYTSYCGTYEVKGDKVVHHIELSLFPNWSGADQERFFRFCGDRLELRTPPMVVVGVSQTIQLIWQRATPAVR